MRPYFKHIAQSNCLFHESEQIMSTVKVSSLDPCTSEHRVVREPIALEVSDIYTGFLYYKIDVYLQMYNN